MTKESVRRRPPETSVKFCIEFCQELHIVCRERCLHPPARSVCIRDQVRQEVSRYLQERHRLDQLEHVIELGNLLAMPVKPACNVREQTVRALAPGHEVPTSVACLDDAACRQRAQGFAYDGPRDSELTRELAFRWKPRARPELVRLHAPQDLVRCAIRQEYGGYTV